MTTSSGLEDRYQTLHEIARAARMNLAAGPWDYLIGGTETETTLKRNRQALDSIAFRPRVLRNVAQIDTSSTLFGRPVRIPVMIAPVGSVESFTPGGGATAAKASGAFGVPQMLSSVCNPGLEAVAKAADNFRIFQLYVRGDDTFVDDHVTRALDNGYAAFCLTVDSAMYSRRERDIARRFVKPWRQGARGMEFQAALSWDEVKRFKDRHHGVSLILKGIATAEDATSPASTAWRACTSRITAAASSITGAAAPTCCPKWWPPWPGAPSSSSMAATCAGATWSRPSPSAPTWWAWDG